MDLPRSGDSRNHVFLGYVGEALVILPDGRIYRADMKQVTGRFMGAEIAVYENHLQQNLEVATITSSLHFRLVASLSL